MNRAEIVTVAKRLGYTHVQTFGGLLPLDSWTPYGQELGEKDIFERIDDEGRIRERLTPNYPFPNHPFLAGVWPLSKGGAL
jgi:hypothetical protein